MNKFKIGDICVIQNVPEGARYSFNGEEVTITGLPGIDKYDPTVYSISGNIDKDLPVGLTSWYAPEVNLRLKRDGEQRSDMDKAISWDDCVWKPRELVE